MSNISIETSVEPTALLLEMKDISKAFPGVRALNGVDFSIRHGEVVSLIGQNGAGKSTLVSILGGIHRPDVGEVRIEGNVVRINDPAMAETLGVGLVHQEPTLVADMTVAANLFLNREWLKAGVLLDVARMESEAAAVLARLGSTLDPRRVVGRLKLVEKEVVEIAKAMLTEPRILVLDEVTAPLNAEEVKHVFALIDELKRKGIGIVFISHRLDEIIRVSDRIVVLRDGRIAGELNGHDQPSEVDIIDLMLGSLDRSTRTSAPKAIAVVDGDKPFLSVSGLAHRDLVDDVSLRIEAGEIVGLAGLKGSGITEILKCIFGALPADRGSIEVNGKRRAMLSPRHAIRAGVGMITNDRQAEGLALRRSVDENITVTILETRSFWSGFFNPRVRARLAEVFVERLGIKTASVGAEVQNLSGGNQQKVVVAKWLLRGLDFLLVDEPTRGVDVAAQAEIHRLLVELKREGKGLLVTSPELSELLALCDRILIVAAGKIVAQVHKESAGFNEGALLAHLHVAAGIPPEESVRQG